MDPKQQENYLKKYDEKNLDKLQARFVFTDPTYLFVSKKTEKVVAALYLITNLISDSEPIKFQIRKASLGLVSDTMSLKKSATTESKKIIVGLMVTVSEVISLLKVAFISEHVSSMNFSVMQRELSILIDSLQNLHGDAVGNNAMILSQDFFNVPAPVVTHQAAPVNFPISHNFSHKGHYRTSVGIKDNQIDHTAKDNLKDMKNDRRESVIKLLRLGKPMGIKDFAREIKGCSEKTIQRELLAMVESGVLKKTGERRWSLYSLV